MSSSHRLKKGKMIIVTAPSGAGKTTLVRHLLNTFDILDFSISATTRPMRSNEHEGEDYFFRTKEEFHDMITNKELAEWEEVYPDRYYGTLKSEINRIWKEGKHIVFDIDVKGAINLQAEYPENSLTVFIKPPSLITLVNRLKNRKTETVESLKKRIKKAKLELTYETLFNQVLVNDELEVAKKDAEKIVQSYIFGEEE